MPLRRNRTPAPLDPRVERRKLMAALDADQGAKARRNPALPRFTPITSACGACGAAALAGDREAVQTWSEDTDRATGQAFRSWRYHRGCVLTHSPVVVARVLNPDARPLVVTRAHADVARSIGAPLLYRELPGKHPDDSGRYRRAWSHVSRRDLEELADAVGRRESELTVPVRHESGWPCAVCGRSHELKDGWVSDDDDSAHRPVAPGRPLCATCTPWARSSRVSGNERLEALAYSAANRAGYPDDRERPIPFPLAHQMASYRRLEGEERRDPWAYVVDLPLVQPTEAERLAELERRLAGVAA